MQFPLVKCRISMTNQIIQTKNYGKAEVIGEGSKYNYFKVRFFNTGHVDEFRKDAIERGEIRDKYAVTLCGVGIVGNIKTRGKYKQYYNAWRNMITRCYSGTRSSYRAVTVCDRWKTFENFYDDAPHIPGWNEQEFLHDRLSLDKDCKQRFLREKVYSPETCMWLSWRDNEKMQDSQQRSFQAIAPDGTTYADSNITDFARRFGLERRQISAVLHGRFKTTMGWRFSYIDKEIV